MADEEKKVEVETKPAAAEKPEEKPIVAVTYPEGFDRSTISPLIQLYMKHRGVSEGDAERASIELAYLLHKQKYVAAGEGVKQYLESVSDLINAMPAADPMLKTSMANRALSQAGKKLEGGGDSMNFEKMFERVLLLKLVDSMGDNNANANEGDIERKIQALEHKLEISEIMAKYQGKPPEDLADALERHGRVREAAKELAGEEPADSFKMAALKTAEKGFETLKRGFHSMEKGKPPRQQVQQLPQLPADLTQRTEIPIPVKPTPHPAQAPAQNPQLAPARTQPLTVEVQPAQAEAQGPPPADEPAERLNPELPEIPDKFGLYKRK